MTGNDRGAERERRIRELENEVAYLKGKIAGMQGAPGMESVYALYKDKLPPHFSSEIPRESLTPAREYPRLLGRGF